MLRHPLCALMLPLNGSTDPAEIAELTVEHLGYYRSGLGRAQALADAWMLSHHPPITIIVDC